MAHGTTYQLIAAGGVVTSVLLAWLLSSTSTPAVITDVSEAKAPANATSPTIRSAEAVLSPLVPALATPLTTNPFTLKAMGRPPSRLPPPPPPVFTPSLPPVLPLLEK